MTTQCYACMGVGCGECAAKVKQFSRNFQIRDTVGCLGALERGLWGGQEAPSPKLTYAFYQHFNCCLLEHQKHHFEQEPVDSGNLNNIYLIRGHAMKG
eukprot:1160743-Pelagomonas_calceolata.AAC.7